MLYLLMTCKICKIHSCRWSEMPQRSCDVIVVIYYQHYYQDTIVTKCPIRSRFYSSRYPQDYEGIMSLINNPCRQLLEYSSWQYYGYSIDIRYITPDKLYKRLGANYWYWNISRNRPVDSMRKDFNSCIIWGQEMLEKANIYDDEK